MNVVDSRPRQNLALVIKLRALMARTIANGCTPEEELQAARKIAQLIAELDGPDPSLEKQTHRSHSWAAAEKESREYQLILERNTSDMVLKSAISELALNHIHNIAPPRQRSAGLPTKRMDINALLMPHLSMMMPTLKTRSGQSLVLRILAELVEEGAIPQWIDIPLEQQRY